MNSKAITLLLSLWIGLAGNVYGVEINNGLPTGTTVPNFITKTLDGKMFKLSKLQGKKKVVNFFLVTCIPCKKELPLLAEYEKAFKSYEFVVVHVDRIGLEEISTFLAGLKEHPETIVIGSKAVKNNYNIKAIPYTIVLDGNNLIKYSVTGGKEDDMVRLRKFLAKN